MRFFLSPALLALTLVACSGGKTSGSSAGDDDDVVGDDDDVTGDDDDDDDVIGDDDDTTGDDDDTTGDDDDDTTGDDDDDDSTVEDADADGVTADLDCDDSDATIFPGAEELCDDVDHDCDGDPSNGLTFETYYADGDLDGFGAAADAVATCDGAPVGFVALGTDCDDTDDQVHPDAVEVCDDVDHDCDGGPSNGLIFATFYGDGDLDGFGEASDSVLVCDGAPPGYVSSATDCDDADDQVNPGAAEVCDDVDHDCDGLPGNGLTFEGWFLDADGDGAGSFYDSVFTCDGPPAGHVAQGTDCDDADDTTFPGAPEQCDAVDHDCDGDPANGVNFSSWYADADGDGFGDYGDSVAVCGAPPQGYVQIPTDCDDADDTSFPGAVEQCDAVDHDCDGGAATGDVFATVYPDVDLDGFGDGASPVACNVAPATYVVDGSDCDDGNLDVHPAATETCNGIDDDCDSGTSEAGLISFDDGTTVADLSSSLSGSTVTTWTSPGPGRLDVCEGTWHVRLSLGHDVDVVGHPGGTEAALEGDFAGTVVSAVGADVRVNLVDLVVQEGLGSTTIGGGRTAAGGAVACNGPGAFLQLEGVTLKNSAAAYGGGLVAWDCDVVMVDSLVMSNGADLSGAGAFVENGTLDITGTTFQSNDTGLYSGGAVYLTSGTASSKATTFAMRDDSWLTGNHANNGAAVYMNGDSTASCEGVGSASGVINNEAWTPTSAAIHLGGGTAEWVSTSCDYANNDPADVVGLFSQQWYGLASSFVCTSTGC